MNGDTRAPTNQFAASSSSTTGATGRKSSRSLMSFSRACISAWIGDARMLRAPSARQAQPVLARLGVQPARQLQHRLFQHDLQRVGDVVMALVERPAALPRRAEALLQPQRADRVLAFWPQPHEVAELGEVARPA